MRGFAVILIVIGLLDMIKINRMKATSILLDVPYTALEIGPAFLIAGIFLLFIGLFLSFRRKNTL